MKKGIFWLIENELLCVLFDENCLIGVAKSGTTYNHKRYWEDLLQDKYRKPFNYYPRGRVDIDNKLRPVVYLNPSITDDYYDQIKASFEIDSDVRFIVDNSAHYGCVKK